MKRDNLENGGDLIATALVSFMTGGAAVCASFMVVGGHIAKSTRDALAAVLAPFTPQPTAPENTPVVEETANMAEMEKYGIKEVPTVGTVATENTHKTTKDFSDEKR